MLLSWLFIASAFGQIPTILSKGKADSQGCKEWVESRLEKMTLKEKIGQLFIHTVPLHDTEVNRKNIRNAVKEYKVGGFLFDNGQLVNQVNLTNYAQEMAEIPLLITFDGEWGLNMRLKEIPAFPRNRVLGCIQDNNLLYEYGKEVARQFREIGVHVNFAPVADVDNNPLNPVINTRSFGGDVRNVTEKVLAYSKGLEDGGVLSVSKHFPGHGDCEVDSHLGLPTINYDLDRIHRIEMHPFKENINVPAIMSAHIMFPAYDTVPATLSKNILTNVLRNELGFEGLILTDCLEMKAIADMYGTANGALMAVLAGADLCDISHTLEYQIKALELLEEAVNDGRLPVEELDKKVERILKFKEKTLPYLEKYFYNQEMIYSEENNKLAQKIVDNSLTKVLGNDATLTNNTLIIAPVAMARTIIEDEFDERNLAKVLRKEFANVDVRELVNTNEFKEEILSILCLLC